MKDLKIMTGEQLFRYYTGESYPDKDYASIIQLLPCATLWNIQEAYRLLKEVTEQGKKFVTVYPGLGEKPHPDMKYVGPIMDGALYIE